MNRNFALACAAIVLIAGIGIASAGPEDGHKGRGHHGMMMGEFGDPGRMLEFMSRRLDLDSDQEQRIGNILDATAPESEALRERGRAARDAFAELDTSDPDYDVKVQDLAREIGDVATAATLLHGRVRAQVAQELTPEQAEKLAEGRARMHKRFDRGQHRRSTEVEEGE